MIIGRQQFSRVPNQYRRSLECQAIGITRQLPVKEPDITLLFLFRTLFGDIRCYQAATTYPQTYGELSQILKDTGFHNCMQLQSKVRNKKEISKS